MSPEIYILVINKHFSIWGMHASQCMTSWYVRRQKYPILNSEDEWCHCWGTPYDGGTLDNALLMNRNDTYI